MSASKDLLVEITGCAAVGHALTGGHPCARVVGCQDAGLGEPRQVPEPWNGRLTQAPLLFVSSNPSISEVEEYPTAAWTGEDAPGVERGNWPAERVVGFFDGRFDPSLTQAWIRDGTRTLQHDGGHSGRVPFLAMVQDHARDLYADTLGREVVPGEDYCLTEVVHCKSTREKYAQPAATFCADRYLDRILALSPAAVVVVFGAMAAGQIRPRIRRNRRNASPFDVVEETFVDRKRLVVFMPHPNARTRRTMNEVTADDRTRLRDALRVAVSASR